MAGEERFFQKLNAFLELNPEEAEFLTQLLKRRRQCLDGESLLVQGESYPATFVLLDGWAVRHKALENGRRQILNVILPGDSIGLEAHVIGHSPASVTTLTECTLAEFRPAATVRMLAEQPRLAAAMLWATAREEAFLGERLLSLGRRPAIDRVGNFIVELYHRLRLVGLADGGTFVAPLNLDHIADALGLSLVHVSRTFGRLRQAKLLLRRGHSITILDLPEIERRTEFAGLYLGRRLPVGERFLRAPFSADDLKDSF